MIKKEKYSIIKVKIGEKLLQMEESHQLPIYYNDHPFYDRALPRIAKNIKEIDGYLNFIDIGSNIGDTVSLITDKVDGSFLCVEGDQEYLPFLKENLKQIKNSNFYIEESYCGEANNVEKLKIHRGNGTTRFEINNKNNIVNDIKLESLDNLVKKYPLFEKTNLLKIDTDGFEINVLKSGGKFITQARPVIYFEFDPEFYSINNEDPFFVFDFLYKKGYKEALFYDNFGIPNKILDISNREEIKKLVNLIDKQKIYYFDILVFHSSGIDKYKSIFEKELFSSISLFNNLLETNNIQISFLKKELEKTKNDLGLKINELISIYSSRGWRLISLFREYFYKIFPNDNLRKKIIIIIFSYSKKIGKFIRKIITGVISLFMLIKNFLFRFKSRKKRKINYDSKKVLYVGHSYHNKTKSTVFLIDYLKEFFEVEVVSDTSWEDSKPLDLSFVDDSYLGVIFFQLLPSKEVLSNIKNDNIIFFPMYDGVRQDYLFWNGLRDLKIINFSKTLHRKLKKWGLDSIYIQYFPKPKEFISGNKDEIFFWQRLTHININTITKLFKKEKFKIHLHKALDPWHSFVEYTKDQEKNYNITYSDWFNTREEMLNVVKGKGIYIAPREYEGIGMSFLEAMAMGKAVVAIDNPTMNEYITDKVNGYLFDLKHPKEIDFSNIEQIQKNTYQYMQNGYENYEKEKIKIIYFIKK